MLQVLAVDAAAAYILDRALMFLFGEGKLNIRMWCDGDGRKLCLANYSCLPLFSTLFGNAYYWQQCCTIYWKRPPGFDVLASPGTWSLKKSQISPNGNPVLLFNWSWNISANHVATKICKAALCFSLWIRMIFWYKVFMSMIVVISIHLVWLSQKYNDIFFYLIPIKQCQVNTYWEKSNCSKFISQIRLIGKNSRKQTQTPVPMAVSDLLLVEWLVEVGKDTPCLNENVRKCPCMYDMYKSCCQVDECKQIKQSSSSQRCTIAIDLQPLWADSVSWCNCFIKEHTCRVELRIY